MNNPKEISVVVPCFNEGETIRKNIQKIHTYLMDNSFDYEIIAVNDGSGDNTLEELEITQKEFPLKIIDVKKNGGKGGAVKMGILESRKNIVMFLDADLAIPIEELQKFIEEIERGSDIVIASRFVPGLKIINPILWYRKIMEKIFRFFRIIILNSWNIQDTQCGFKVFRGAVAKRIFSMSLISRFAFDAEIIFIAKKFGYNIRELPVTLQNPKESSVRIFFDPLNMFVALFRIRLNDLTGKYPWKNGGKI